MSTEAQVYNNPVDRIEVVNRRGMQGGEFGEDATLESLVWEYLQAGTAAFTVSPMHPVAKRLQLRTRDSEVKITTANGDEWWGFPVSVNGGPGGITFQCEGIYNLIAKRFIDRSSLYFGEPDDDGVEQMDIVSNLITYAQSEAEHPYRYENIWPKKLLQYLYPKNRWRKYLRDDSPNIQDLIAEFNKVDPPLGWRISWEKLTTEAYPTYVRWFNIFPQVDAVYPLSFPLVYVEGGNANNITDFSWAEDSSNLANAVWCKGGSAGDVRFEGVAFAGTSIQMHSEQTAIISEGDMKDTVWLTDRAHRETLVRSEPKSNMVIRAALVPELIGQFMEDGQVWPIKVDCGRIQIDYAARVLKKEWKKNGLYEITFSEKVASSGTFEP